MIAILIASSTQDLTVSRSRVRFASLLPLTGLLVFGSLSAQTKPTGGVQPQAQCLPENCGGGGGSNSVTVLPDDGVMTVTTSTAGNVAEFTVLNNYGSSYVYNLTCATVSVGTCTAIKNASGTTITSINLPGLGQAEVMVYFTATGSPTSGTVTLTADNGLWSDLGTYAVTVNAPPAPAAPTAVLVNHNRSGIDRGLCFTAGAGQAAGTSCGDLFITHGLPAYRTLGRDRSLTLLYNSAAARGQAVEVAAVSQAANSSPATKFSIVLQIGGLRDSADYGPIPAGTTAQISMGDRLANTLVTGVYVDTMRIRSVNPQNIYDVVLIDTVVVVSNRLSEYGRGWGLVGVERLLRNPTVDTAGLVWVGGDGSVLRYQKIAPRTWVAPAMDFRDTITVDTAAHYVRLLRHKVKVVYDSATGLHLQTINRYGQVTQFLYDTVSTVTRLARIRMPGNDAAIREYKFYWSPAPARLLDSIADPGGRKLKLTRSGTAITAIADADGQQTQFVYGGPDSLLSARKVPNPVVSGGWAQTTYLYTGRSKLARTRIPAGPTGTDSTVIKYVAWQANGLDTLASGILAPVYPTSPVAGFPTTVDGPIAGTGDLYSAWVDQFGEPTRTLLAGTGTVTTLYRDSTAMPALVTRMQLPNLRWTSLRYNSRGNLVMQRDSARNVDSLIPTNVTTWTYGNASFPDTPTAVSDLFGRTTSSVLHSIFGVPTSVTDPTLHTTTFGYLSNGLVQSVSELSVDTWIQSARSDSTRNLTTTFEYDGMGQVRKTVAPNGTFTVWQSDTFGRVKATWDPFNTRTQFVYDSMNRVRSQIIDSGAVTNFLGATNTCAAGEFICGTAPVAWPSGTPASFVTSTYYGTVGLDSVVGPRSVPRGFRYDAAGAPIKELDQDTATGITTFLNSAGLVDHTVSRDSQVVRFGYDAVGRLAWKAWPARSWSALYDDGHLARPAGVVVGDSVVYRYDLDGNLLAVRGTHLVADSVVRTYWANGSLRTVVTSKALLDSLSFWYDSTGALERKAHVSVTGSGIGTQMARDTTIYQYGRTTGTLNAMVVVVVNPTLRAGRRTIGFTWDALGRRRSVTYPTGLLVTLSYDAGGTMRRLLSQCSEQITNLCVSVANDSVDMRGEILNTVTTCGGEPHDGSACGNLQGTRIVTNAYFRTGWLARQVDGSRSDSTFTYDPNGNVLRRWDYDQQRWHKFSYQVRTNRLIRDSANAQRPTVTIYSANGDRLIDTAGSIVAHNPGPSYSDRYYYYDALGRTTGIVHFDQTLFHYDASSNDHWYLPIGGSNDCQYDVEGRMTRACGAWNDVAYDGPNVGATNDGIWHFIDGPGVDDPILGIGEQASNGEGASMEMYWVTDGQGRQYASAASDGTWDPNLNFSSGTNAWSGYIQAGGITEARSYNASRQGAPGIPGVSYFRNRVYDQGSGQWTQEDPIGLAGGLNLYQYSGGNPVSNTDPFGLFPCPELCGGGAILSGGEAVLGGIGAFVTLPELALGAAVIGTGAVLGDVLLPGTGIGTRPQIPGAEVADATATRVPGVTIGVSAGAQALLASKTRVIPDNRRGHRENARESTRDKHENTRKPSTDKKRTRNPDWKQKGDK